ncbi:unnamed protein product [Brassica rapa]|uniref:Uncharacterized protein n=1 Tax=Brassica campestris TaxID=3711 RepID=A0A8D9DDS6_BRACM|nr:unnamed protein product [Brassica rapa]
MEPGLIVFIVSISAICSILVIYMIYDCITITKSRRVGLESRASGQEVQYDDELGLAHQPKPTQ